MYSVGKPVDLHKQTQIYVYRDILLTFIFTIVQTYIISLILKSKDMAVNFLYYTTDLDKSRNQLQISRSVSNESDSAYSNSSCENIASIPDNQTLDYSSESYCSSECSEGNSPFINSFSLKSSLMSSCDSGCDQTDCLSSQELRHDDVKEYYSSCPVFNFDHPCAESETVEVKVSESAVTPGDLVHLMNNNESVLLLDCRSFMAYNTNHITNSFNINCSDRITKKRLNDGKIQIVDVICGNEGKEMYRRHEADSCIIVYDEGTVDLEGLAAMQPIKILIDSLRRQNKVCKFLQGGLQAFQQTYSQMCTNPEPLSNLPILFSPTSPELNVDIDAAVVSEILPQVLIGNQRDAADRERLRELGITHIINVTAQLPLNFENDGIIYKRIPASDNGKQNLKQYFEEVISFIDDAVEARGRVLVHCQAGVSRSPTVVIAYLMARSQRTLADAFAFVKERRAIVAPNLNFMGQLLEFEQKSVLPSGLCPPSTSANLLCL